MRRTHPMMGESNPQPRFYYNISLESFVPVDHPLRRIRPLIDHAAIRRECGPLYSDRGRPSIPPEQLFLALIGGYLLGVTSERRLVMELQCNMALRWFVGLNIDEDSWDASTFSQNRRRRFDKAGILERLFDQTLKRAFDDGLVSHHVSGDGTLVRANASYKSFVPIEVALNPEEYKERLRRQDKDDPEGPQDPGNRAVDFRGEKRSNSTHRSITDPDCRYVSKGSSGTGAYPGYTQRGDGEPQPYPSGYRRGGLPGLALRERRMSGPAAAGPAAVPLSAQELRRRQGVLRAEVHRVVARGRNRAAHRHRHTRERRGASSGAAPPLGRGVSVVATLPEEDRGAV